MTLYNNEILKLATSTANFQRLINPQATSEKRAPLCGSRVTVDVRLDSSGNIDALGLEVRACALGQAAAALMAAHALGCNANTLDIVRDDFAAFLCDIRIDPGDWPGLEIFRPAVPHRARHASILLAFDAVAEAARAAQS